MQHIEVPLMLLGRHQRHFDLGDGLAGSAGTIRLPERGALHQGIAAGLAVLAGRGVGGVAELATSALSGGSASLKPRLAASAAIATAGQGLALIPARDGEPLAMSAVRSGGRLMAVGAASCAVYDSAMALRDRIPGPAVPRIVLSSLAGAAGVLLAARRRLHVREELVQEWTVADKPATSRGRC